MSTISGTFTRKTVTKGRGRRKAKKQTVRLSVPIKKLTKARSAKLLSQLRTLLKKYSVPAKRINR